MWLNEGFATLYEHEAVDLAYPEMGFSDLWSTWVVQTVFAVDSADTTRPMTHYAESPREISNLFDRVAYPKCEQFRLVEIIAQCLLMSRGLVVNDHENDRLIFELLIGGYYYYYPR